MFSTTKKLLNTLTPIALFVASQCSIAHAENTVNISDKKSERSIAVSTTVNQAEQRTVTPNQRVKMYGPTRQDETLWSLAEKVKPAGRVSRYQNLLAIYRLNPQAFEFNNIHGLRPNSQLRLPTLAQARRESISEAKRLLEEHKHKNYVKRELSVIEQDQDTRNNVNSNKTKVYPEHLSTAFNEKNLLNNQDDSIENKRVTNIIDSNKSIAELKAHSSKEFLNLKESSEQLRIRIDKLQRDVDSLKTEVTDKEELRNEIEDLVKQQTLLGAIEKENQPTVMDKIVEKPSLIALFSIIPGFIIAVFLGLFLFRRKKEKTGEEHSELETEKESHSRQLIDTDLHSDDTDISATEKQKNEVSSVSEEYAVSEDSLVNTDKDDSADNNDHTVLSQDEPRAENWLVDEKTGEEGEHIPLFEPLSEEEEAAVSDETANTDIENRDKLDSNSVSEQEEFISIQTLMADAEGEESTKDEEELNLEVGLDEFPDVLSDVNEQDVDVNSEAHSKLDLAKIYIDMFDNEGAIALLEDVLQSDDPELKAEAEKLMKQLS